MTTPPILSLTIPVSWLKACASFSSTDDTRYILQSLNFVMIKGSLILQSTDGRALLQVKLSDYTGDGLRNMEKGVTIPVDWLHLVSGSIRLEFHQNEVQIVAKYPFSIPYIDLAYPNTLSVIPKSTDQAIAITNLDVNLMYIIKFQKAAKTILSKLPGIRIRQYGSSNSCYTLTANPNVFGVIMPIRIDDQWPTWLD